MKKYPDHTWLRQLEGVAYGKPVLGTRHKQTSTTRACMWVCTRCGWKIRVEGYQHPTFQNQLDQGVHLNCDMALVLQIMLS